LYKSIASFSGENFLLRLCNATIQKLIYKRNGERGGIKKNEKRPGMTPSLFRTKPFKEIHQREVPDTSEAISSDFWCLSLERGRIDLFHRMMPSKAESPHQGDVTRNPTPVLPIVFKKVHMICKENKKTQKGSVHAHVTYF